MKKCQNLLGNVKSVNHVLETGVQMSLDCFVFLASYSKPIDYSEKLLKENITKLRQIESCYYELRLAEGAGTETTADKLVNECKNEFDSALNNDFNTPLALDCLLQIDQRSQCNSCGRKNHTGPLQK